MSTTAASIFGPFFFGVFLDAILYGVVGTHAFLHFTTYKRDRRWVKAIVVFIVIVETLHTAFLISSIYKPLVIGFGDMNGLLYTAWESHSDPVTTAIVASTVQCFFSWRIWVLTGSKWLVSLIVACSAVQLLGGTGETIAVSMLPYLPDFVKAKPIIIVWLVSAVVTDVLITTTLVIELRSKKTGIAATDTAINKITRRILLVTIETGLLTSIWATTDLIVYLILPTSAMHLLFNLSLSKLYSISLLVSLNARHMGSPDKSLRGLSQFPDMSFGERTTHAPGTSLSMNFAPPTKRAPDPPGIFLDVDVEAHEMGFMRDSYLKGASYFDGTGTTAATSGDGSHSPEHDVKRVS